MHTTPEELEWFLDHGATINKHTIQRSVHASPLKAACVELLLQRYGIALFRGTRLLQSAAKRGRTDVVKLLLESGMDVDELIARTGHNDGECEATALYEAVYKQHGDTVELLLAFGANPEKEVCTAGANTPLKLAEAQYETEMVSTLRKHRICKAML